MPRNPKTPVDYVQKPRQRAREKLEIILEILGKFHHSTRELLLKRLGLATHSHHNYFKTLENKNIIRRVEAYSIRNRFVYMLTPLGKSLAAERLPDQVLEYNSDPSKINHSTLRHDLAVQKAVIERLDDYDSFTSERYLPNFVLSVSTKKPDACLEKNGLKTMLEIEITPKQEGRVFRNLISHAEAMLKQYYHKVVYIFPSATVAANYKAIFDKPFWPYYEQNERGRWTRQDRDFRLDDHPDLLRDCFEFRVEKTLLDDI